jgi:hypothetical protein
MQKIEQEGDFFPIYKYIDFGLKLKIDGSP